MRSLLPLDLELIDFGCLLLDDPLQAPHVIVPSLEQGVAW